MAIWRRSHQARVEGTFAPERPAVPAPMPGTGGAIDGAADRRGPAHAALALGQWSQVIARPGLTTADLTPAGPTALQAVTIERSDAWAAMNPAMVSQQGRRCSPPLSLPTPSGCTHCAPPGRTTPAYPGPCAAPSPSCSSTAPPIPPTRLPTWPTRPPPCRTRCWSRYPAPGTGHWPTPPTGLPGSGDEAWSSPKPNRAADCKRHAFLGRPTLCAASNHLWPRPEQSSRRCSVGRKNQIQAFSSVTTAASVGAAAAYRRMCCRG